MTNHSTIWLAIDLWECPSGVKRMRSARLPSDVSTLLRIAIGDEEAVREAIAATGRLREILRNAAGFYIEQILFHPDADSYRVLGAHPNASAADLRQNMALLMRWVHPDQQSRADRSIFAARVAQAWSDLKTDERRAAYDRSRRAALAKKTKSSSGQGRKKAGSTHGSRGSARVSSAGPHSLREPHPGPLMRVLFMLFGRALQ